MILRDVLRQVVIKANIEDKVGLDDARGTGTEWRRLMLASNNVIREIACSYLPLLHREVITIENNRFDMRSLTRKPVKILSLYMDGSNIRFKMYPTYMYAQNGTYEVEYSYLPEECALDDTIEVDMRVSENMLSDAIASEYALMTGNIALGDMYDKKFRAQMKNITVSSREIRVKGRAFV